MENIMSTAIVFRKVLYFMLTAEAKFSALCLLYVCMWKFTNVFVDLCVHSSLFLCFYELSVGARGPGYEKESQWGISL